MSRACPLCSASSPLPIKAMSYALPEGSTLPEKTIISQCSRCGFLYADSNASAQAYQAHYESDSIYAASDIRPGDGSSQNDKSRLTQAAERLVAHMPAGSLLIDIGAATGGMLAAAGRLTKGPVLGLDPDPVCVEMLRQRGYDAQVATLSSLPTELSGRAGGMVLSHVLEHLWDPAADLRNALDLLRDDGVVYIETPDAARYLDHPNALNYYFDPEHINHFTLADFKTLACQAGAHVIESGETTLFLENEISYPAAWALLQKGPASLGDSPHASVYPVSPHPALAYIEDQNAKESQAKKTVEQLIGDAPSILIWGTGSHAQRVIAIGSIPQDRIAAFIDSDPSKQKRTLFGKITLSPEKALDRFPGLPVMVLAASAAESSIRAELAKRWPERQALGSWIS